MRVEQPWVSQPSVSAPPLVQSEWEQLPWGGSFDVLVLLLVLLPPGVHWPLEHVSVLAQATPHAPQLLGSLVVSTHWPLQTVPAQLFVGGLFVLPPSSAGLVEPPSPPLAMMPPSLRGGTSPPVVPTAQPTMIEERPQKSTMLRMTAAAYRDLEAGSTQYREAAELQLRRSPILQSTRLRQGVRLPRTSEGA